MPRIGRRRIAAAGVATIAFGAVMALALDPTPAPAQDVSFPLLPVPIADTTALDDGYNHFVVHLADTATATAAAFIDDGPAGDLVLAVGDGDGLPPVLVLDDLTALGGRLDHLDGDGDELVAVLTDGSRIPMESGIAPVPASDESLADHPEVIEFLPLGDNWFAVTTALTEAEFETIARAAGADEVGEDVVITTASDDPHSKQLWGLENDGTGTFWGVQGVEDVDVDGTEARAAQRGAGVVVAVIDSGSITTHEDLPGFWTNSGEVCGNRIDDDQNGYVDDCSGWDFYNNDNTPHDRGQDNDHGTHVTGTIAAVPDNGRGIAGLAPGVTIMNLKALQSGSTRMSTVAAAVRYAVDNGAQVINASWGSQGARRENVPGLDAAVTYAEQHGVIIVAAAGNDGANLDGSPSFPASFPQDAVISVGALQADGRPASFSNRSTTQVDLHAPGHYILSSVGNGGYSAMQGTSMAAPHVTAGVAMLLADDPTMTIADVRTALFDTVDYRPALAGTSVTSGSMNVARALGLEAGTEAGPLQVVVEGAQDLAGARAETMTVRTSLFDPSVAHGRKVDIRATLLTAVDDEQYAVVDHPIKVNGRTTATDAWAQFTLAENVPSTSTAIKAGVAASVTTELPEGMYAIVVELVDSADPEAAYGPPALVVISVGPAAEGDSGTDPGTETPNDDTPPTTNPPSGGYTPPPPSGGGGGGGGGGGYTPPPSSGGGGYTPPPTGGGGGGGGGYTPPPSSGGGYTPPPTGGGGGGGGGYTPPPSSGGGGYTPPPSSGGGGYTPPPSSGGGGYTPPPSSGGGGYTPPPSGGGGGSTSWYVTKMSPNWGPPEGGRSVTIFGDNLPDNPTVDFGGAQARVVTSSPDSLTVRTPPHAEGTVDVTVQDQYGRRSIFLRGYTYAADRPPPEDRPDPVVTDPGDDDPAPNDGTSAPPTTNPGSTGPGNGGSGGGGAPDPTDPGDPGSGEPGDPTDPDPTDPGDDADDPFVPSGRGRHGVAAEETPDLVPGLRLHAIEVGMDLPLATSEWRAAICARPSCAATYGDGR